MAMALADNPALVVKTRAQGEQLKIQEKIVPYLRAIVEIAKNESISGLYAGFGARCMVQGVGFSTLYVFYDYFIFDLHWSPFAAGCVAVLPSWMSCYPFEGIFSRQVLHSNKFLKKYFSFKNELKRLKFENSYRGFTICMIRAVPRY